MKCNRALALVGTPPLAVALTLLLAPAAQAASDFDPAAGSYTINTTNLTLTGPGGTDISGAVVSGVAVFSFNDVSIPSTVTITASGSRPLEIKAAGTFDLGGVIDGSGASNTAFATGPFAGGPGGGAGGAESPDAGSGPGAGGGGSTYDDGGGGGGFGGAGAAGATESGAGGAAGATYGSLSTALQGGSGGGGASDVGGGGGGGAIELSATSLSISASGSVLANGGEGDLGNEGASGGGSGGGILLDANTIDVAGTVSADGGDGGSGGCCGDGGGGGGGRVAYNYVTLTAEGSPTVAGGTSGAHPGPVSTTYPSPKATGTKGVVTKSQAGFVQSTPATGVTSASATLNGNVSANKHSLTYQFEYGTTTAYGTTVPASPASGGSGSTLTPESVALIGELTPGTTYHYRIVGYSLGLTLLGGDETFKTRAAKPSVTTGRATDVKTTSATARGSVTPGGSRTKYYVQYYSVKGTLLSTHAKDAGKANKAKSVSLRLTGLSGATWYHYRIVAKDSAGTTHGRWRTFRTRGAAASPTFTG